jgi:hypothetical protein
MPKPDRSTDLLLLAGKVITLILQAAMAFGAAVLVLVLGALAISHNSIQDQLIAETGRSDLVLPLFASFGVLLVGFAIVAALFVFFGKLRAIINTVSEGDPFVPVNAERLSLMAWLMLGVQLLVWAAIPFALQLVDFVRIFGEDSDIKIDGGFDISGILLIIILFILARVFRHGAALREDLEGTV